jgi:hypothetical protein
MRNKPRIPWIEEIPQVSTAGAVHRGFRSSVRTHLESLGHQVEFRPVTWSGRNRHRDRVAAAQLIETNLQGTEANAIPFVIAHGQGGNAALLAVKGGSAAVQSKLGGTICLSTPFLHVRESRWALSGTIAWFVIAALTVAAAMFGVMKGSLFALGPIALITLVLAAPVFLLVRRFQKIEPWRQAPKTHVVPVMVIRSASHDFTDGLAFAEILAKGVQLVDHFAAYAFRWVRRYPVKVWIMAGAGFAAVALAASVFGFVRSFVASSWPWLVGLTLFPVVVAMPVRLAIYALAYGLDTFGLPLVHAVSAESTPVGRWMKCLVEADANEQQRLVPNDPRDLKSAHKQIAAWIDERVKARAARAAAPQRTAPAGARPAAAAVRQQPVRI